MNNSEDSIIKDRYLNKEISLDEYYSGLSFYTENILDFKGNLNKLIISENGDMLSEMLAIGYKNQFFSLALIDELNKLLIAEWHTRHEEIAAILCNFPNEKSIDFVKFCADKDWKHEEYNDASALRGKLLYILRKINTPKAKNLLIAYSNGKNKILKDWANFQLSKM